MENKTNTGENATPEPPGTLYVLHMLFRPIHMLDFTPRVRGEQTKFRRACNEVNLPFMLRIQVCLKSCGHNEENQTPEPTESPYNTLQ